MRKAKHSNTDGWLTILNYRATPQQDTNISPAQCFFGRCPRTRLPQDPSTSPNHLDLGSAEDIPQLQRQVRQKKCYDRNAHPLPSLSKGDPVRVQMQDKWIPAIVKVLSNQHMPSRLQMELNIFVIVDASAILLMTKGKLVSMTIRNCHQPVKMSTIRWRTTHPQWQTMCNKERVSLSHKLIRRIHHKNFKT